MRAQETSDLQYQQLNNNSIEPHTSGRETEDVQETNDADNTIVSMPANESPAEDLQETSNDSQKPICRICFGGDSNERLLSPCMCKGTIGYVHRNCLEHWLGTTNTERCELCNHAFTTFRTRKRFGDWCSDPSTLSDRKNAFGDLLCFIFLTPLGMISFYLCVKGAYYFYEYEKGLLEATSLVGLAAFLTFAYCTWVTLSIKYHYSAWLAWRMRNWNIRIFIPSSTQVHIQNHSSEEQDEDLEANGSTLVHNQSTPALSSIDHSSQIRRTDSEIQRDRKVSFREDYPEIGSRQQRGLFARISMSVPFKCNPGIHRI